MVVSAAYGNIVSVTKDIQHNILICKWIFFGAYIRTSSIKRNFIRHTLTYHAMKRSVEQCGNLNKPNLLVATRMKKKWG